MFTCQTLIVHEAVAEYRTGVGLSRGWERGRVYGPADLRKWQHSASTWFIREDDRIQCVCECELSRRTDCLWDEKSLAKTSDTAGIIVVRSQSSSLDNVVGQTGFPPCKWKKKYLCNFHTYHIVYIYIYIWYYITRRAYIYVLCNDGRVIDDRVRLFSVLQRYDFQKSAHRVIISYC